MPESKKEASERNKRHDKKRKSAPRLPGTRISESESNTMEELYALFESKSEAIVKASEFYLNNRPKD